MNKNSNSNLKFSVCFDICGVKLLLCWCVSVLVFVSVFVCALVYEEEIPFERLKDGLFAW